MEELAREKVESPTEAASEAPSEKRKRRHGPREGITLLHEEGGRWIFRKPAFDHGRWRVRKRNKDTGKFEMETLNAETLPEARREVKLLAKKAQEEWEAAQKRQQPATPKDLTVAQAFDEWVHEVESLYKAGSDEGMRGKTIADYKANAKMYARLLGPERTVESLTYGDVAGLYTGPWEDLSGRTKILRLWQLIRFFRWAARHGLYRAANPAEMFDTSVTKKWQDVAQRATKETGQALTLEEMRKLLDACRRPYSVDYRPDLRKEGEKVEGVETAPPEHLFPFVFLALRTGLRVSNLIGSTHKKGLRWGSVDLDAGTLQVSDKETKTHEALELPLHKEAIEFLRQLRGDRIPSASDPVIPGVEDYMSVKRSFHNALVRAGLENKDTGMFLGKARNTKRPRRFRIHDLRHSIITLMGLKLPDYVNEFLSGHSSGKTQNSKYGTHFFIEDVRKCLNKLPSLLSEPKTAKTRKKARA